MVLLLYYCTPELIIKRKAHQFLHQTYNIPPCTHPKLQHVTYQSTASYCSLWCPTLFDWNLCWIRCSCLHCRNWWGTIRLSLKFSQIPQSPFLRFPFRVGRESPPGMGNAGLWNAGYFANDAPQASSVHVLRGASPDHAANEPHQQVPEVHGPDIFINIQFKAMVGWELHVHPLKPTQCKSVSFRGLQHQYWKEFLCLWCVVCSWSCGESPSTVATHITVSHTHQQLTLTQ